MSDATVTFRVDKRIHDQMKHHDEVNWSAVLRKSVEQKLEDAEHIDVERAHSSLEALKRLRTNKAFDRGKSTGELIREWRDKRR